MEYQTSGLRYKTLRYPVFQRWYLAAQWDSKGRVLAEQWEWNIEFGPITNSTFFFFFTAIDNAH